MNLRSVLPSILLLSLLACTDSDPRPAVIAYVSHDLIFSEPILREFERQTGIDVRIVGDTEATKTTGLALRLLASKENPVADVFWNNEVMRTVQLADAGLFSSHVPPSAVGLPSDQCDTAGRWVGFAARARVLLYNRELVGDGPVPATLQELTEERFRGKVAIANPLFGTTATHVAALFASWGESRAKEWLLALKANDVVVTSGNAMARNMVRDGRIPFCLTDTDDANGALLSGAPVEMVYLDQGDDRDDVSGDGEVGPLGTLLIPNTVALVRGGPNPEAGKRLVEFIASREVEEKLAKSTAAQMPLRADVPPYGERFDRTRIKTMKVNWSRVMGEIDTSARFVKDVFLK